MFVFQPGGILKRRISDTCDATWNRDVCQADATGKRIHSDACNVLFNYNFFYVVFLLGCRAIFIIIILHRPRAADGHCAVGGECPGQVAFVPVGSDFACIYAELSACQLRAFFEVYGQLAAAIKRKISDACDTLWNGDACQAAATVKRIISDACDTTWNIDAGQVSAIVKRKISDACNTLWNADAG